MRKSEYRDYFSSVCQFVKMSSVLKSVGVSRSAYNLFMKGIDGSLSLDTLSVIKNFIENL